MRGDTWGLPWKMYSLISHRALGRATTRIPRWGTLSSDWSKTWARACLYFSFIHSTNIYWAPTLHQVPSGYQRIFWHNILLWASRGMQNDRICLQPCKTLCSSENKSQMLYKNGLWDSVGHGPHPPPQGTHLYLSDVTSNFPHFIPSTAATELFAGSPTHKQAPSFRPLQ